MTDEETPSAAGEGASAPPSAAPAGTGSAGAGASSAGSGSGGGTADATGGVEPAAQFADEGEDGLIRPAALKERAEKRKIAPIKTGPSVRDLAHIDVPRGPQKPGEKLAAKPGNGAPPKDEKGAPLVAPGAKSGEGFKFAGRNWKDQAEAEQNVKSLQGQFQPLTQRAKQATEAFQQAESAGLQWKQLAEEREKKIAEYEGKLGITKQVPDAAADPLDVLLQGDDVFNELMSQGKTDVAMRHLVHTALTKQQEAFNAKLEGAIAPFREQAMLTEVGTRVTSLMEEAAGLTAEGPNGPEPVFAELQNEEGLAGVGRIWAHLSQGWSPEFAVTPMGMYLAVLAYRDQQAAYAGAPAATAPGGDVAANANAVAARITAELAGNAGRGGDVVTGGAPPAARTAGVDSLQDGYRRAIRDSEPINAATGVPW